MQSCLQVACVCLVLLRDDSMQLMCDNGLQELKKLDPVYADAHQAVANVTHKVMLARDKATLSVLTVSSILMVCPS